MTTSTAKLAAGNSRAAYTRQYRKRKRLEKIIVIMYPNEITCRTTAFSTLVLGTKVPQSFFILLLLLLLSSSSSSLSHCHLASYSVGMGAFPLGGKAVGA
jgi:hypothetical protein